MNVFKGLVVLALVMSLVGCETAVKEEVVEEEVKHEIDVDRKNGFGNTWQIELPKFED